LIGWKDTIEGNNYFGLLGPKTDQPAHLDRNYFSNVVFDDEASCTFGRYSESHDWESTAVHCSLHLNYVYYRYVIGSIDGAVINPNKPLGVGGPSNNPLWEKGCPYC
jgi:hypothetical protein